MAGATVAGAGVDAGFEVAFVLVGAAGAVGAMVAAGVTGDATGVVVPTTGVACPTGTTFGFGTFAAASA
ncbi:MAG: hypothetical protein EBU96_05265 [Actinobacteria bacterium]|nr:hypothetical protein [Actinomycetota bacterium]